MERVDVRIGSVAFDHADYDAENDVLYLHVGEPQEAEGDKRHSTLARHLPRASA